MSRSLVVGAGPIGLAVSRLLVVRGDDVVVATRRRTSVEGATPFVLDAGEAAAFVATARGRDRIFLCTNPPYTDWPAQWPPIFSSAVQAAAESGADLIVMGNLYPYGRPDGRMSEGSPETTAESKGLVRRAGWELVRTASERGELRAVEVRASDYFGPGAGAAAHLGSRFFRPLLAGRTARVVGEPRMPHSWSYLPDIAETLVAASGYSGQWSRVWHVPSSSELSRQLIADQLALGYHSGRTVAGYPAWILRRVASVNAMMREIVASSYQFTAPYLLDSAETERELAVTATSWDAALATTVTSYGGRPRT